MEKIKTVVIDDEAMTVDAICDILHENFEDRVEVTSFVDPVEAKKHISEKKVDLLITDLVMASVSGETLIKHTKEIAPWAKCIGVTGDNKLSVMLSLMQSGVDAFIRKPFKMADLSDAVEPCVLLLESWKKNIASMVRNG